MFDPKALIPEMQKLRGFALRLTKNNSDAEDLVQATLLRALEKKEQFQEGTSLFSWASKIMFNLFASAYRHNKKFGSQYDPEPVIMKVTVQPAQEACADLSLVRDCMKRMNPVYRDVIVAVCIRGMKYEEVSELMQIPVGTVRSRLNRARAVLTQLMEAPAGGKGTNSPQTRYLPSGTSLTRHYAA